MLVSTFLIFFGLWMGGTVHSASGVDGVPKTEDPNATAVVPIQRAEKVEAPQNAGQEVGTAQVSGESESVRFFPYKLIVGRVGNVINGGEGTIEFDCPEVEETLARGTTSTITSMIKTSFTLGKSASENKIANLSNCRDLVDHFFPNNTPNPLGLNPVEIKITEKWMPMTVKIPLGNGRYQERTFQDITKTIIFSKKPKGSSSSR